MPLANPYTSDVSLEQIVDFSNCPDTGFSVERYLDNGIGFRLTKFLFSLRLNYQRILGVYLRDSWLRKIHKIISNNFRSDA